MPWFTGPAGQARRLGQPWWHQVHMSRLKIVLSITIIVVFITPMRNILVPFWPHVYRDMSTFKVIRIYLEDWFYYVNTTTFDGSCDLVHQRLKTIQMPRLEDMKFYDINDWNKHMKKIKPILSVEEFKLLDKYKPSMSILEQKYIMFTMLSATQAMTAFGIPYLVRGGSLIGYYRHHGRMPWDEDVDLLVSSDLWPLARVVLSCLPDLQINLGPEFMWKLFHKKAGLWTGENKIKFPYVDIFLYRQDSDHVWPLTIWMKMITMKKDWALPPSRGIFEGWPIAIPNKPSQILKDLYPKRVMFDCFSQIFNRRRRQSVTHTQRTVIPCSVLRGIYPLVVRRIDNGVVIEDRMLGSELLSTFNTTYQGFFD